MIHANHQLASTSDAGTALSQVILPEVDDDLNLLAHELGHVLGGCHSDGSYCYPSLWVADADTVLDYGDPVPHGNNSPGNCDGARSHPQPLLATIREGCHLPG